MPPPPPLGSDEFFGRLDRIFEALKIQQKAWQENNEALQNLIVESVQQHKNTHQSLGHTTQ